MKRALMLLILPAAGCSFIGREFTNSVQDFPAYGNLFKGEFSFCKNIEYLNDINRKTVTSDVPTLTDRAEEDWLEFFQAHLPHPNGPSNVGLPAASVWTTERSVAPAAVTGPEVEDLGGGIRVERREGVIKVTNVPAGQEDKNGLTITQNPDGTFTVTQPK
jgi:hypothetical protein